MKVIKISIKNILGLESLDIEPGSVTQISGENGSGKTSCLDAIRCALGSGHDATLLRQGAEEGEIVLVLDDGTEIKKQITAEKSDLTVKHPTFGRISKPATYLKKLADALSLNPVEFLTAPAKSRVNILLEAIPMQVNADQLGFVPAVALNGISLDGHALDVIGKIERSIYDLRTGVNRASREKAATVRQMTETLPADAPEGDWGQVLQAANEEYRQLQQTVSATLAAIDREKAEAQRAAEDEYHSHCEAVKKALEEAIEKLRADAQIEIDQSLSGCAEACNKAEDYRMQQRVAAEQDYRPKEAALKEKIGQAKAMVEQVAKSESTRGFIATLTKDAEALEVESTRLTHAMDQLEILKASLLDKLPIEGLEVKDGDIYVGGLPFDRVNESKRIRLAIEIAKLRAGSLGLVAVDGLERLDAKTFEAFKKAAAKSKLQFVISRVTEGPLAISTESEVA